MRDITQLFSQTEPLSERRKTDVADLTEHPLKWDSCRRSSLKWTDLRAMWSRGRRDPVELRNRGSSTNIMVHLRFFIAKRRLCCSSTLSYVHLLIWKMTLQITDYPGGWILVCACVCMNALNWIHYARCAAFGDRESPLHTSLLRYAWRGEQMGSQRDN